MSDGTHQDSVIAVQKTISNGNAEKPNEANNKNNTDQYGRHPLQYVGWRNNRRSDRYAAVFRNTTKDMQQTIFISGGGAQSNVENAGESTIDGFEIELLANPWSALQVGISYGYLDAEYNEFMDTDPITGQRRDFAKEKDFPYTPRHSLGAHIDYLFARTAWGELRGYLDYQYVDDYVPYVNPVQNKTSKVSSYQLLNGRLTLGQIQVGNTGTLDIGLWGKNLLDKEYRSNTVPFGPWTVSYYGDPRTYGIDFKYSF